MRKFTETIQSKIRWEGFCAQPWDFTDVQFVVKMATNHTQSSTARRSQSWHSRTFSEWATKFKSKLVESSVKNANHHDHHPTHPQPPQLMTISFITRIGFGETNLFHFNYWLSNNLRQQIATKSQRSKNVPFAVHFGKSSSAKILRKSKVIKVRGWWKIPRENRFTIVSLWKLLWMWWI